MGSHWRPLRLLSDLARHRPFLCTFLLCIASNAVGSVFNILYNTFLILDLMSPEQRNVFWNIMVPAYNALAYPLCLATVVFWLWTLSRCHHNLITNQPVATDRLQGCQRMLVNLPCYQVCVNLLGWLPGAFLFPLVICLKGGWENSTAIFTLFAVSFVISTLLTTVQTYFIIESFLVRFAYPDFFQSRRPADITGTIQMSLGVRLSLYWIAVSVVPLAALLAVALSFPVERSELALIHRNLSIGVAVVTLTTTGVMSYMVGKNLLGWVNAHSTATLEIARENYDYRIAQKRPDELGRLTDRFNDMAADLGRASQMHKTFGEFLNPEVLEEILFRYPKLEGEVCEITVLFLDIRGFTRRSAGEKPERIVTLLNRFLSLAVAAVEQGGGWVNKFLGDGLMALFGSPRPREDHADLAVTAAANLMSQLALLNKDLAKEGQAPLTIGIGIHTGPALVGCIGAELTHSSGRRQVRREFTAIGETVNMAARIEQLTKSAGGPVLLSEQTRQRLTGFFPMAWVGPQKVAGFEQPVTVHRLEESQPG